MVFYNDRIKLLTKFTKYFQVGNVAQNPVIQVGVGAETQARHAKTTMCATTTPALPRVTHFPNTCCITTTPAVLVDPMCAQNPQPVTREPVNLCPANAS